jgi:hypothetical protein
MSTLWTVVTPYTSLDKLGMADGPLALQEGCAYAMPSLSRHVDATTGRLLGCHEGAAVSTGRLDR